MSLKKKIQYWKSSLLLILKLLSWGKMIFISKHLTVSSPLLGSMVYGPEGQVSPESSLEMVEMASI